MSRTRLFVSVLFVVILGLLAAPAAWAGGLKTGTPVGLALGAGGDAVLFVDLNGDNKMDMVVADCALNQVEIFQGNGDGTFVTPGTTVAVGTCPDALAYGKLTGSVRQDIVVGHSASGDVYVLQNDGAFSFTTIGPITLPNPLTANVTAVGVADMDGDGKPDIVVADAQAAGGVVLLLGNATASPGFAVTTLGPYATGAFPDALVVSDFNGDSEPDVAVANFSGNTVTVLTNNTAGFPTPGTVTFATATPAVGTGPVAIAAGVIGGSGKPDLVVANRSGKSVTVLVNDGSGGFGTAKTATVTDGPTGIAIGDFNADAKNDVVVSTQTNDGVAILFNDGTGTLTQSTDKFTAHSAPSGVAIAIPSAPFDLNGDNYPDVAVVNNTTDDVSILLGTPFFAITPVPVSAVEGVSFAATTPLLTFKYDGATPTLTANIDNWGDGTNSAGTISGPDVSGVYTVQGGHTYSDPGAEGSKNIFLTVTDTAPTPNQIIATTAASTTTTTPAAIVATVADGVLSPAATADLADGAPPMTYTGVTVANFTDQNTTAFNTDFSSSINWGDGSPADVCAAPCATITGPQGGPFVVAGTHTYNTIGKFPIVTTITDTEGGGTQTTTATIHARITNMTVTAAANITPTEGTATGSVPVASFQSGTADATAAYSASIDWGDCGVAGTSHSGQPGACNAANQTAGAISDGGAGNCKAPAVCTVSGNYTYKYGAAGGTAFSVVAYVTDASDTANDGPPLHTPMTATVSDAALSAAVAQPANIQINEGSAVTGASVTVANFTDANPGAVAGDFTGVTVKWNDSNNTTVAGTVTGGPTNFSITASPSGTLYKEEGDVTVTFSVTDSGGSFAGNTLSNQNGVIIHVVDAPLSATGTVTLKNGANPLVANVDLYNGSLGTFSDANNFANLTDFDNPSGGGALNIAGSYVDWGDGNKENCTSNAGVTPNCVISGAAPNFSVAGKHTFATANAALPVVVHVIDIGGQTTTINDTADVTSLNSATPQPVANQQEGVKFTNVPLLNFTSHRTAPAPVAGDFAIAATTVNWGDGTAVDNGAGANLTIVAIGGGVFQVQGTHTYAEESNLASFCGGSPCQTILSIKDNVDSSTLTNVTGPTVTVIDAPLAATAAASLGTVNETSNTQAPPELNGVTVLQFTDANPTAPLTDFTAMVDWGDGTAAVAGTVVDSGTCVTTATGPFTTTACTTAGAFHLFSVTASHNYTEGGTDITGPACTPGTPATCNVKVTVNDEGGSQILNFVGTSVQVADAPLSNLVLNPISGGGTGPGGIIVANVDNWTGTVATFQDGNLGAPTTDFTVAIAWGDGATTNCAAPCALVQANGGGGLFKIVASHIFTKAGSQLTPVTVTVTDIGGAAPLGPTAGSAAVVTSLYQPVSANISPVEGTSFSGSVGTFHATTGNSAFTVSVNFGDGTTVPASSVTGGPVWTVNGTHTYTEETSHLAACGNAPCPLTISVTDTTDGSTLTISGGTATIADAPLTPAVAPALGPVAEGTALSNVLVLNFSDGNAAAPATDFTATIDWGDGVTSPGTVTSAGGGNFTVTGSHTYAEGGTDATLANCVGGTPNATCQIHVTVLDEGGSTITAFNSTSALVSDAPLVGGSLVVNPVSGGGSGPGGKLVANVDTWNGTIATFADTNTAAPTTDFTILIAWGDGTNTTCNAPCALVQSNGGGGLFKVVASHIFTKAGTQLTPVTVTVTDMGGAAPLGPTPGTAAVVTSLYQPVGLNIAPVEGVSFTGGVGTFTATTGNSAFTATINWGDGGSSAASFTGGPGWTADGTHTYVEETAHEAACGNAPCAISFTVTDTTDGSTLTISGGTATITDAPLTPAVVGPLGSVNEGAPVNNITVLNFTDLNPGAPASDFTATIDWGDGTTSAGTVTGAGGSYSVAGSHTYLEGGLDITGANCVAGTPATCQIHVTVLDEGGSNITNFNSASIQVADAPLTSPAGVGTLTPATLTVTNAALGTFHDGNPNAPATDFTATINWGDTTSSAGTVTGPVGGPFTVIGTHTYTNTATLYSVSITVNDIGGASTTITGTTILTPATGGSDFLGTASPPTSSILPGEAVDVLVTLSPQSFAGYNSQVTFTGCEIVSGPVGPITCAFQPNSVPDVTVVRTVHMFVQTFSQKASNTAPPRPGQNNLMRLALMLPGFVGVFGVVLLGGANNSRRRTILWFIASLLLLTVLLVGCGGGGQNITPGPNATAPGSYTLRVLTSDPAPAHGGNGPDIQIVVNVQ